MVKVYETLSVVSYYPDRLLFLRVRSTLSSYKFTREKMQPPSSFASSSQSPSSLSSFASSSSSSPFISFKLRRTKFLWCDVEHEDVIRAKKDPRDFALTFPSKPTHVELFLHDFSSSTKTP